MEKNTLESALKEFSQTSGTNANDVKEFFALMSDGSIKRMPKEDMATVLGGLIYKGKISSNAINLNTLTTIGRYYINNVTINSVVRYGILLVYVCENYIVQEFLSNKPEKYGVLIRGFNGIEWGEWKELDFK